MIILGLVYPRVLGATSDEYIKWIACSLITWQFIASGMMESCSVFTASRELYLNHKIPFWFFALKNVITNLLVFLHQLPIYIIVAMIFKINFSMFSFLNLIIGVLTICIFIFNCSFILGISCVRFKDIIQIIANLMNIFFLVTPVIWNPKLLKGAESIINYNPFYYLLESLRAPLLGSFLSSSMWITLLLIMTLLSIFSYWMYSRYKHCIVYWT